MSTELLIEITAFAAFWLAFAILGKLRDIERVNRDIERVNRALARGRAAEIQYILRLKGLYEFEARLRAEGHKEHEAYHAAVAEIEQAYALIADEYDPDERMQNIYKFRANEEQQRNFREHLARNYKQV